MAERNWTAAQQHCIDTRGGSVLVSAAAGSGKTSVLIERVVRRITDPADPVDIDRLLIVTFTKAAAAEMKQRLSARLAGFIAAEPENTRLRRQQMLLPSAPISTIHGFCTSLLREHFDLIGLSPRFRVAEEKETAFLKTATLEEVLEVAYAARADGFLQLCDLLNRRRDDSGVKEAILTTYDFIGAQAFPRKWLRENAQPRDEGLPLSQTVWGKVIRRYAAENTGFLAELLENAVAPLRQMAEIAAYVDRLEEYLGILKRTALTLADETNGWDTCIRALEAAIPPTRPSTKKLDESYIEPVKNAWDTIRHQIRDKLLPLFCENEDTARRDVQATYPKLQALCELVEAFDDTYTAKKAQSQILDFNDLEHLTLRLLRAETGEPTPLARELAGRYREILVDEYQDTNDVQDTIFRMLSGADNTLFMVGDVKQSIYGFRQAMPEIFMQKKAAFAPFDGETFPACITLGENFRSRRTVTASINFVFNQLMTAPFCGIDYAGGEELVYAATYPDNDTPTELLLMDNPYAGKELSAAVVEARVMAVRIRELLQNEQVTAGGVSRPARLGDICILLRGRAKAAAYAAELERLGIPVAVDTGIPFFELTEIRLALSLLRTIDNPLRDTALMALLLSPLGGFSADDLARLRIYARDRTETTPTLYSALCLAADRAAPLPDALRERAAATVRQLQYFRRLAVSMPADALITRLFEETPLLSVSLAQSAGESRVLNLRQLLRMAREFEQNGFRGLSGFVRQMDRLEAEQGDEITAPLPAGQADTVSIMTIHGSKGLEFPFVLLADLFHAFSTKDSAKPLLLHGAAGMALTGYDEAEMSTFDTVSHNGVRLAKRYTELAEELRVLYVAMTRAREKLIAVFVKDKLGARLKKLQSFLPHTTAIDAARLLSLQSLGDWLLLGYLRHPDAVLLRHLSGNPAVDTLDESSPLACRLLESAAVADEALTESSDTAAVSAPDAALLSGLRERLSYTYPYAALQAVPVKLAASALAHRELAADFVATRHPAFLSTDGLTPAERGTALHTFMQYADYAAAAADTAAEADRLYADGFLSAPQRDALDIEKLRGFFDSELYARMCASPRVLREYPFTVPFPAAVYDPSLPPALADETVIVQGIADCAFEEDGRLVIVDYKTDWVRDPAELAARYAKQLEIYRQALTETLGLPIKETLLYAFHLGCVVPIA